MAFTPTLTPGRADHLGHMQVPHDVFLYVTTQDGWSDDIASFRPINRQHYLESIKYWMDLNGACIIRSASSSKFAAIKDITQCATILYGNQIVSGDTDPQPPIPTLPDEFAISASPQAAPAPFTTTLTIDKGENPDPAIVSFDVTWFEGDTVHNTNGATPMTHEYTVVGDYVVTVQAKDADGAYQEPKTILVTAQAA